MGNDPERDKRPLRPEDLPPELLHTGRERFDDRTRGNPSPEQHDLTFCSMRDVNGEPINVIEMKTIDFSPTAVRIDARTEKSVVKQPSLWDPELPSHHRLTHALRLLQMCSETKEGVTTKEIKQIWRRKRPSVILQESGLPKSETTAILSGLQRSKSLFMYTASGSRQSWMIDISHRAIDETGEPLKADSDKLVNGWQLTDTVKPAGEPSSSVEEEVDGQVDTTEFFIGERPRLKRQDDRAEVLTKLQRAFEHLAENVFVVEADEDGWFTIESQESMMELLGDLTKASKWAIHSMIVNLQSIGTVLKPELISVVSKNNPTIYRWKIKKSERPFTDEDVQIARRERQVSKAAKSAGSKSVAATTQVVPTEIAASTDESAEITENRHEPEPDVEIGDFLEKVAAKIDRLERENAQLREEKLTLQATNQEQSEELETVRAELRELQQQSRISKTAIPDNLRDLI